MEQKRSDLAMVPIDGVPNQSDNKALEEWMKQFQEEFQPPQEKAKILAQEDVIQEPPTDLETALERLKRKVDTMDTVMLQAGVSDMHGMADISTHFAASTTTRPILRPAVVEKLSSTARARVAMQAQPK